jgi:AraC-like DNA-binding protein
MNDNKSLIDTLVNSHIYQEYARAFTETTGLPVALRSVESWQLPHHGRSRENAFCALLSQKSRACAACLQTQQTLSETALLEPRTVVCSHGMSDTAVPVRLGEQVVGFLQTGQVFRKRPSTSQFDRSYRLCREWGIETDREVLRQAYFATPVVPQKRYDSTVSLLNLFAQHLSIVSNQVVVRQNHAEPPMIANARKFITEHYAEDLSLGQVAKAVNASPFYFCNMFKKITGVNFTDFLSRVRIEHAKNLLLNQNLRVSEIAFEVGFQSLTHFNRVFKKIIGQSPTEYRSRLPSV